MGANSKISWTHHTFNPWVGCTKVSPGCKHCYAEVLAKRSPALVHGRVTSAGYWKQPLFWDGTAAKAGKRARVFCASLADVFEDRPELIPHRHRLFSELIARTPNLDWLLLTKRPDQILRLWPSTLPGPAHWPNVWVGCTVEDLGRAWERLPHLLQVPAPVRFVSYEPALESVNFDEWLAPQGGRAGHCVDIDGGWWHAPGTCEGPPSNCDGRCCGRGIDWLIVGGESGHHARPFNLAWARQTVAQCRAAGVPVFVKQMGARYARARKEHMDLRMIPLDHVDPAGADPSEWPEDLRVQEWPEVKP